jgi:hypothetical protein
VTSLDPGSHCALCGQLATVVIAPPRRTLTRGLDPNDRAYSLTVILPDVALCAEHDLAVRQRDTVIGWCDDERCRTYGEVGASSACGGLYKQLPPSKK